MLENATIKMSYKDFREIEDKLKQIEQFEKIKDSLEKDFEEGKEIKTLDKIVDCLLDGYKSRTAKKKQDAILKCIKLYCECFDMPLMGLGIENEE